MAYRSDRVAVTDRARNALRELIEQHGPILLYLPGDDSGEPSPRWLPIRDFRAADDDTLFGRLAWHTELWMSSASYTRFEREHLTVDVPPAPGSAGVEETPDARPEISTTFLLRTRRLSAAETAALEARKRGGRGNTG